MPQWSFSPSFFFFSPSFFFPQRLLRAPPPLFHCLIHIVSITVFIHLSTGCFSTSHSGSASRYPPMIIHLCWWKAAQGFREGNEKRNRHRAAQIHGRQLSPQEEARGRHCSGQKAPPAGSPRLSQPQPCPLDSYRADYSEKPKEFAKKKCLCCRVIRNGWGSVFSPFILIGTVGSRR